MNKIATSRQGDAKAFFDEYNAHTKPFTNGDHNLSVDGSGKEVSVDATIAQKIVGYIKEKFTPEQLTILDIGTGLGYLVDEMNKANISGYGIEGSRQLVDSFICDKRKVCTLDLSHLVIDKRLNKAFNLTTSFEVLEHIHRSDEDIFFANLSWLSDYHFCSIHMLGWPGIHNTHCNIKHECCWIEYFMKHNIGFEILSRAAKNGPDDGQIGKPGSIGGPYIGNVSDEFKTNWECSTFMILNLKDFIA